MVHQRFRAPPPVTEATEKKIKSLGKALYITGQHLEMLPDDAIIELPGQEYYLSEHFGTDTDAIMSQARNSSAESVYLDVQFPVYEDKTKK